jgi:arsenite-transporting ATPase
VSSCSAALVQACAADATFASLKRRDQARSMELLAKEPQGLGGLQRVEAPLFDLEIRGVPALAFFGSQVWT